MTELEMYKVYKLLEQFNHKQLSVVAAPLLIDLCEGDLSEINNYLMEMKKLMKMNGVE